MDNKCFNCENSGIAMYGYFVCDECKNKLGLFSKETIKKHISLYKDTNKSRTYEDEIDYRLDFIEKDYIKKKIKLLDIKNKLQQL